MNVFRPKKGCCGADRGWLRDGERTLRLGVRHQYVGRRRYSTLRLPWAELQRRDRLGLRGARFREGLIGVEGSGGVVIDVPSEVWA